MSNRIVKAMEDAAKKIGKSLAQDAGKAVKDFYHSAGTKLKTVAKNTAEADAKHKGALDDILNGAEKDAGKDLPHDPELPGQSLPGETGPKLAGADEGGQPSEGNGGCTTAGDPVDVISGQMIMSVVDLELPGLLPLVLGRSYASGYRHGQLFGPGWASTLDQRLRVDASGIHYAGEDAQLLRYPLAVPGSGPVLPAYGARRPLVRDEHTDEIRIEDPETGWTRHFAAADGAASPTRSLDRITDRNGNRIDFLRDESGLPTEIRHYGGYRVAVDVVHTAAGPRIEALRLLDGTWHGLGTTVLGCRYDIRGRLVEVKNSSGLAEVLAHDAADRITSWTDRNGFWYAYEYDADGRVGRGHGSDGVLATAFEYDDAARVTTVTDSLGRRTRYHYDEHRHLTEVVDPAGHTVHTEHDRYGQVRSVTDQLGRTTRYDHDAHGRVVRIDHADGAVTAAEYNRLGLPTEITMPGGATWRYEYDERGNRLAVTDPADATTRYAYDDAGRLGTVVDPAGRTTTVESNPAGLPLAVTDPLGHTTGYVRDPFGRITAQTDPLGAVTRYEWTVEGRPTRRVLPDGSHELRRYDAEGALVEHRDAAGGRTRYEVGCFGQTTARVDAAGRRWEYRYDSELRLVEVADPAGRSWHYRYDPAGNLESETDGNGRTVRYQHDAAGQLTKRTNGAGQSVAYEWDAAGRIVAQTTGAGARAEFRYDAVGNLVHSHNGEVVLEFTHDAAGRVLTEAADGLTLVNRYDEAGRRVERRTPGGTVTRWEHDANHQVTAVDTSGLRLLFGYSPAGHETVRAIGADLALTSIRDSRGRLTARQLRVAPGRKPVGGPTPLPERHWTYRADGAVTSQFDGDGVRHFELDPLGQVTASRSAEWTEEYSYDSTGNLLHAAPGEEPAADSSGDRTLDGMLLRRAGRCSYEYDEQGRLTRRRERTLSGQERSWQFRYDAHDRLTDARVPNGDRWHYVYDPLGRRTAKRLIGADGTVRGETRFCWDDQVLAEQGEHVVGRTTVTTRTWEYEPQSWAPVAQVERTRDADGTVTERHHAVVTDLVGTPTELVTADGTVVWQRTATLWGGTVRIAGDGSTDCPLRFPGQYHDDETGLHYNLHRYYDPQSARFTAPDPLGLAPAPNHYAYVTNPLDEIDPLGLAKKKNSGGGGGSGGGNSGGGTPSTPAPGSRAIQPRQPPPKGGLPGFPNARRVPPKTPVQRGGGLRPRWEDKNNIYEWDSQHGEIEMYDKQGKHLGAYDPNTGQPLKGPVKGRTCVK
ncbi:colicin E3/pyocin S6 family cytotoxin [Kitasatospora viridis]|uniref:RHS repeat-associated protein n=1 Tax=Kitasatospora viridis TaxID=281105 RepID=A0A561TV30_9ACTN|nr:colicin E3/pyocin S6 family cytotoxin [Kitasatospora viridis]TWF90967.1 RHS repeat-associated protein [Kitasatospora viridis]